MTSLKENSCISGEQVASDVHLIFLVKCSWAGACSTVSKGAVVFLIKAKTEGNSYKICHQESNFPKIPFYLLTLIRTALYFYLLFYCEHHIIIVPWKHWSNVLTWIVKTFNICVIMPFSFMERHIYWREILFFFRI